MGAITVVMGDLVTGVVVTAVLIAVVELLVVAAAVVAVAVVVAMAMVLVLVIDLLREVIMIVQHMVMAEGMAMEAMLDLGLVLVVAMVAPCTEGLMVHMGHMVVVPMERVPTEVAHMEVVPMVAPRVAMVPEDMVVMGEQEVLVVGVQEVGVLAGTIRTENEHQLT